MLDPITLGMVAKTRQQDRLGEAERQRVGRETVRSANSRRARLAIRQPVGDLIIRLGNRLANPAAQRQLRDAVGA